MYRVQPAFPQSNGRPSDQKCDELIAVEEFLFKSGPKYSCEESVLAVLETFFKEFGSQFEKQKSANAALRLLKKHLGEEQVHRKTRR